MSEPQAPKSVADLVEAAAASAPAFAATSASERAALLDAIAGDLDAARDELVPLAEEETRLTSARLASELGRTTYQLRAFARLVRSGRHVRAIVEHADIDYPLGGPAPDLRSMLHPIGVVAVFAASNFPFAFSVAGGDTASALAAGCPVVVKAHPGHPKLSRATATVVDRAIAAAGLAPSIFALVEGEREGVQLLQHPGVAAGAFTGSTAGGRALFDIASRRPVPIPFYGELGSVNPVYITTEAVAARTDELAQGFVASYTLGTGQFCTKPGIVFVPAGTGFAARVLDVLDGVEPAPMLNERIRSGYDGVETVFTGVDGVKTLRDGGSEPDGVGPSLFLTDLATFVEHGDALTEERFGPSALIVEYRGQEELIAGARVTEATLTSTVHARGAEDAGLRTLVDELRARSGRLVYNGWPTGVTVSAAMMHGGPYPATTSPLHTSVGATAIGRFLRPVAYQNFPDSLLPPELAEANPLDVPREVDLSREGR